MASSTQGRSPGPGATEKSTDFGLGWAWLLATPPLPKPRIRHGAACWQGGHNRRMEALAQHVLGTSRKSPLGSGVRLHGALGLICGSQWCCRRAGLVPEGAWLEPGMGAPSLTGPGPSRGSDPALARVGQPEMQGCLCPPHRPLSAWPGVALGTCRCRSCSLLGQCCIVLCCLCSSLSGCPLPRGAVASSSPLVQKHGLPWSPSSPAQVSRTRSQAFQNQCLHVSEARWFCRCCPGSLLPAPSPPFLAQRTTDDFHLACIWGDWEGRAPSYTYG